MKNGVLRPTRCLIQSEPPWRLTRTLMTTKCFPGPNSNSFVAWIALEVPELGLYLTAKALGRTWMNWTYDDHGASAD
jgi:hypothetical protein